MSLEWWILALGASGVWQSKLVQGLGARDGALETQFTNSLLLLVVGLVSSSNSTRETETRHREGPPCVGGRLCSGLSKL